MLFRSKTAPTVSSIVPVLTPTNGATASFTVTFSESVTGESASSFSLTTSGITGASVTGVTGSGATRTVTVNTGTGDGTIRLDLTTVTGIADAAGNALVTTYSSGTEATIEKTAPVGGTVSISASASTMLVSGTTIYVGLGGRTNAEGIRQLRALLGPSIEVIVAPLPHWHGAGEVLHLMSLLSPVDRDLAVVYSPLMPVPFRSLLLDRGYTLVETPDGPIVFVDTAGMRRRSRIDDSAEYYSMVRALRAIDDADIALLVIDATEGVTAQDQRLAERVDASGCPIVVMLNKWELLDDADTRAEIGRAHV